MRVAIGSDHAGFELKEKLREFLCELGYHMTDLGTDSVAAVDYPDLAAVVGRAVRDGKVERGILLCGSGVGASVAANKIKGVRAGLCHDHYSAHQGVEHDDMNLLVLGARVIGVEVARDLATTFLQARFSGEERHQRRLEKTLVLEEDFGK